MCPKCLNLLVTIFCFLECYNKAPQRVFPKISFFPQVLVVFLFECILSLLCPSPPIAKPKKLDYIVVFRKIDVMWRFALGFIRGEPWLRIGRSKGSRWLKLDRWELGKRFGSKGRNSAQGGARRWWRLREVKNCRRISGIKG